MLKLLKVEFKILFKWKPTRLAFVSFVLLAVLMSAMSMLNEEQSMSSLFNGLFIVNLIAVAIGGLFINNDYSQNTIRNKITVGHSRSNIYCAKFISVFVFYIMLTLIYAVPSFLINYIGLGTDGVIAEAMYKNIILVLLSILMNTSLTVFIAMTLRNVAGGVMPVVLAESIPVAGTLCLEVLSVSDKPDLFKFVQAVPTIQGMMLSPQVVPENIGLSVSIAFVFSIVLLTLGYLIFRKADLN
jgi:ABC-type transport system involved in multi-copper enzyme maturation permease subunit